MIAIFIVLLIVAIIVMALLLTPAPKPPDEEAVSLDIVPGPIEEQQPEGDDSGIDSL